MITFLRNLRNRCTPENRIAAYLLSNESRELMAYRVPKFGLSSLFDAFLVSAYIRLRKPGPALFQCALDISQRRPEQCGFIDEPGGGCCGCTEGWDRWHSFNNSTAGDSRPWTARKLAA